MDRMFYWYLTQNPICLMRSSLGKDFLKEMISSEHWRLVMGKSNELKEYLRKNRSACTMSQRRERTWDVPQVWITICTWEGGSWEGQRKGSGALWVTGGGYQPLSLEQWEVTVCFRTTVTCLLLIFPEVGGHGGERREWRKVQTNNDTSVLTQVAQAQQPERRALIHPV